MVWTFSLSFLFILSTFPQTILAAGSLANDINLFRNEISTMRQIVPSLPWPDPAPSDIEELSKKSPSKAAVQLRKSIKEFKLSAAKYLKLEIVNIGRSVESSKTNSENYDSRRTILVALENAAKTSNLSISGLFPKGPPSIHLPVNNSGKQAYVYCDVTFSYLSTLLYKSLPSGLKTQVSASSKGSGSNNTDKIAQNGGANNSSFSKTDNIKHPDKNSVQSGEKLPDKSKKEQWQVIGMYFNWVIYIFAGLALAGLLHHLYKSFSGISQLTHDGLKSKNDDELLYHNSSNDFKKAMKHFKSNQYQKAIDGFSELSDGKGNLSHNAIFYQILSEIGLAQTDRALNRIEKEGYQCFSLEELYRLAHSFEDTGDLDNCLKMYVKVQKKDNTFRNIAQRVNAMKQKIELKRNQEK